MIIGDDIAINQLPGNVFTAHRTSIRHESREILDETVHSSSLTQRQPQLDQPMIKKKRVEPPR